MAKSIPWDAIKLEYETRPGVSTYDLSKRYPVTRQGIEARAKKEGWTKANHDSLALANATKIVQTRGPGIPADKRSPENIAQLINIIALTGNEGIAARAIGIDPNTLTRWKQTDKALVGAIQAARNQRLTELHKVIHSAADRGDWKAAERLLQTAPETRETFNQHHGSGGITIVLQVPREPQTIKGEVIDQ